MRELRSPKNLTRTLLTNKRETEPDRFEARFETRLDRKGRKARGNLGLAPRVPLQVMAQAVSELEGVAGHVNSQMRAALERLLRTKGEHLDPDAIRDAIKRVARIATTTTTEANGIALATANRVEKFNRRDVQRAIGINVPEFSKPIGERWRREHVALIKSLPEEAKDRFATILRDASQRQTRVETIIKALREQEDITHRRARLIARDQVLTLNAKLTEDRHKRAGIEEYEWLTVRDGSVRSNHAHLHGKRFRYDDPPMGGGSGPKERGNPGDGIGCRCQAIPVIPELEKADPKKGKPEKLEKPKPKPSPKPKPKPKAVTRPQRPVRDKTVSAWTAKVNEGQREAISWWSEDGYTYIRAVQRGMSATHFGEALTASVRERVAQAVNKIETAFATAPKHRGKIYRGLSLKSDADVSAIFKAGSAYETEALSSFSTSHERVVSVFTTDSKVGVVIELDARRSKAHDISTLSKYASEAEVLMQKGEKFLVKSVTKDAAGLWRVVLSE